jgi:hypothetical protein
MDGVVLVAVILAVLLARRVILRRWRSGRISTEAAALLWAAILPVGAILWTATRGPTQPLIVVLALSIGIIQFFGMRWGLRNFGGEPTPNEIDPLTRP